MRELTIQSITKQLGPKDSLKSLADLWWSRQALSQQQQSSHPNASPNPQMGGPPIGHANPSPSFPTPESLASRTPQLVQSPSPEQTSALQPPPNSNPYMEQARSMPMAGTPMMYQMPAGYPSAPGSFVPPGGHYGVPNPGIHPYHHYQAQQYQHQQQLHQQQHQQQIHQSMMNGMMPHGSMDSSMRPPY